MSGSRLPLWGTIGGVVVGVVIAGALVATGVLTVPRHRDDRDASQDFLKAWERSRRGTFVVDSDFTRTLPDGRVLYSASRLVQQPPNRLIRQFGGVSGQVDGHQVACTTDQGGHYSCFAGTEPAPDYDTTVRQELDIFTSYFTIPPDRPPSTEDPFAVTTTTTTTTTAGATPGTTVYEPPEPLGLYRVGYGSDPGCYELFQRIRYPDAPYGRYAQLCFDATTGALRSLERDLASGVVETVTANTMSPQVTAVDLDTSQDPDFDTRMDLGAFPPGTVPPEATTPGTEPPPPNPLAATSNEDLIAEGSNVVSDRDAIGPYLDEAVRRLGEGTLSINDPAWLDRGRARPLLTPVIMRLLMLGIYLPGP